MTAALLVLLALALLAALLGWTASRGSATLVYSASAATLLLAAAASLPALGQVAAFADEPRVLALTLLCGLSTAGGPVVMLVFALVDRHPASAPSGGPPGDVSGEPSGDGQGGVEDASRVLRGGAWIGALERAAIFVALTAGWPDGLLAVVGLKGLGRHPELRSRDRPGVAERFIIGTFTSVLWAVACAGVARSLR